MTPQEQAKLLLDRASRVMSGKEIEICEAVASGEQVKTTESTEGLSVPYRSNEWERIATEFASYLKP